VNRNDYIESGILELYVAGALSMQEKQQVEDNVQKYPEISTEIRKIEDTFYHVAREYNRAPKNNLKEKILAQIKEKKKVIPITRDHSDDINQPTAKVIWWPLAASLALFIISAALNFYYYNNLQNARSRVAQLENDRNQIAAQFTSSADSLAIVKQQLSIVSDPAFLAHNLKGLPIAPDASARVLWNPTTQQSYLAVSNLPLPPHDKQYQLWALADGKPIDAGVFDVQNQLVPMKNIVNAEAWAVTLEPRGGSENPTLSAMYLYSGS